jgi:mono/diheme cytochrome c family protein
MKLAPRENSFFPRFGFRFTKNANVHDSCSEEGCNAIAWKQSIVLVAGYFFLCPSAWAQKGEIDPLSWDRNIRSIVSAHCVECHSATDASGDVNLERDVDIRQILDHRETWTTALSLIETGEMPPKDAKQPSSEQRSLLVAFLKKHLESLDCSTIRDPGKPVLRRLNRVEYDFAVQDLTGLPFKLAEGFAPDTSSYGFDNIGEALSISPVQIEQYHAAALIIVEGLRDQKSNNQELYRAAFGDTPNREEESESAAKQALQAFASKAFRRPVTHEMIDPMMEIYRLARMKGESHEAAQGHLITAVLISPYFLLRIEKDNPKSDDPYALDDFELATRLSFFLWSRPPDSVLMELAAQGKLHEKSVLKQQVDRLLKDPRSLALVNNFFGQWLSLRELSDHQPDSTQFPKFSEELRRSMKDEVQAILSNIVQEDRPITDLIDADYTFLNATLASHYEIQGVTADTFQRVPLTDRRRGGILTSAAILMLQSDPTRTNVPRRGNFIAGRILGIPAPPPPPNVPELTEAEADGKVRPLRELLEIHRKNPECANCHSKMDPFGLALENYDAIGQWRIKDGEFPIDASSRVSTSEQLTGPESLKDLLLSKKKQFRRNFVKSLLIYAYGRGLQGNDECAIREVIAAAEKENERFGAIILAVVESFPFRHRRNPME